LTEESTNLLQGTLDLMILKALALQEMHGLGISRRIEQITKGTLGRSLSASPQKCWSPLDGRYER
jgi:DNA-binding PadR family transcriptional regulator